MVIFVSHVPVLKTTIIAIAVCSYQNRRRLGILLRSYFVPNIFRNTGSENIKLYFSFLNTLTSRGNQLKYPCGHVCMRVYVYSCAYHVYVPCVRLCVCARERVKLDLHIWMKTVIAFPGDFHDVEEPFSSAGRNRFCQMRFSAEDRVYKK